MGYWSAVAMGASQMFSADRANSATAGANKTNVKLQREQQAWEERMSNSAVQRRANDIEAAGGNRALAFTNGQEASTPNVAPATVQAESAVPNFSAAIMAAAQLKQVNAQTRQTTADARLKEVEADIADSLKPHKTSWQANKYLEEAEQSDLKTRIMRSLDASSAAEAKRLQGTVDALITEAATQAERGKLDLAALQNIANVGGIEMGKMSGVLKLLIDLFRAPSAYMGGK